jgi:hypothetical protein
LKKANRGGLIFAIPYKGECYKYDFNSRYPSIMCSTKCIPMKKGNFTTITQAEMDKKVANKFTPKYGIYSCKIYKSNTRYDVLFGFNKNNQYTHEDIELAIFLNLRIEVIEKENNAYIYDKDSLIPMNKIFDRYIQYCYELKKQKAPYAKKFLSELWGTLCEKTKHYRIITENADPIEIDVNYDPVSFKRLDDSRIRVEYDDNGKVFVYDWARLGTFLTSMARSKMARFLHRRIDDVVYCHTDGFFLKNELQTDIELTDVGLYGLKYEGYNPDIDIKNPNEIENRKNFS